MINETNVKNFYLPIDGEEYKFRLGAEEYFDLSFDMVRE